MTDHAELVTVNSLIMWIFSKMSAQFSYIRLEHATFWINCGGAVYSDE